MEETLGVEGRFYLEEVSLTDTASSRGTISPLPMKVKPSGEYPINDELEHIQRLVDEKQLDEKLKQMNTESTATTAEPTEHEYGAMPEMIDDFIRNYFANMGLYKTLASFQEEWFELEHKGLTRGKVTKVPSVYQENQDIQRDKLRLQSELDIRQKSLDKTRNEYAKLKKERDYHKMHHLRLEQEKSKLVTSLKWTKNHYESYPAALEEMKQKYETALKDKMLIKLERDRAVGLLASMPTGQEPAEQPGYRDERASGKKGPTQMKLAQAASGHKKQVETQAKPQMKPLDTPWPSDGVKPEHEEKKITHRLRNENGFWASDMPISWIDFHPTKHIVATASDDRTWQTMDINEGEIITRGQGHTDWLSCVRFSPSGDLIGTGSGDRSVRVWDETRTVHTFDEHTQATWGIDWHHSGQFIASCSMDSTSKIWDLGSGRCRNTLRGHANAVMSIEFVGQSTTLLTASSDKTMKLWDARSGLCHHTFAEHQFPLNSASFANSGTLIASVDSNGHLKFWDVRAGQVFNEVQLGSDSQIVRFDRSDSLCAIGCGNGTIEIVELNADLTRYQLNGHTASVNGLHFDPCANVLASASADGTVKLWN